MGDLALLHDLESALCTFAGAVISSAEQEVLNTGPSEVGSRRSSGCRCACRRGPRHEVRVNWMRLKSPEIACATVFTASVFARPGHLPRERDPGEQRDDEGSSRWSCPTMTFLILKSSRSI